MAPIAFTHTIVSAMLPLSPSGTLNIVSSYSSSVCERGGEGERGRERVCVCVCVM